MEEQLLAFPKQFSWEPEVRGAVPAFARAIVCGMGGSALSARLLAHLEPSLPFSMWQDYGLPPVSGGEKPLIILSSYSGDTEEVLDAAHEALSRGLPCAVITSGGALLKLAEEKNMPYVVLPKDGIEPRMAVGYAMLAVLRVLGASETEAKLRAAGSALDAAAADEAGKKLAAGLANRLPLIYASHAHGAVAYFWKIAMNETAKIPAFTAEVPELCHNELCGFDVVDETAALSKNMLAVLLRDEADHPRNAKRLSLVEAILREKGIETAVVELTGADSYAKALYGILAGVSAATVLAHRYGVPDSATPLIADFKKRMLS
jgi:glucose/mannose-6-phosphate isomerase